jgi:type VI secretion system secreted protein VgrG
MADTTTVPIDVTLQVALREGEDATEVEVTAVEGTEGISILFEYEIDVAVPVDQRAAFADLMGAPASLHWADGFGERWVHGLVRRVELLGTTRHQDRYRLWLVPQVWPLLLRRDSRIFQETTVDAILEEVLGLDSIPPDSFEIHVDSPESREYCVQYRESDWEFCCRLMEEEGIYYFFQHTEEGTKLLISNQPDLHEAIENDLIAYRTTASGASDEQFVFGFRYSHQLRQGKVHLRDFNFRRPSQLVNSEGTDGNREDLEFYDCPGEFVDTAGGDARRIARLDELRTRLVVGEGTSNVSRIAPGYKVTLDAHPFDDANQEWLLTRIHHSIRQDAAGGTEGGGGRVGRSRFDDHHIPSGREHDDADADSDSGAETVYTNTFECIPSGTPYRPPRITTRPTVDGPQTAIVVGQSGEEIHVDEHARIKVQFHWDRLGTNDEGSSCWVRVSQGWAGAGWGMMFIPRIGQEVIVAFLEGDPDRPLVTGRVYNGENPPPYPLPDEKTKSTIKSDSSPGGGGFNEIRFEDAAGSEEVYIHAQKDWNTVTENNLTENVGNDETLEVGANRKRTVGGKEDVDIDGGDQTIKVNAGKQVIEVSSDRTKTVRGKESQTITGGDQTTHVSAGSQKTTVSNDHIVDVTGSAEMNVSTNYKREVYGNEEIHVVGSRKVTVDSSEFFVRKSPSTQITYGINTSTFFGANVSNSMGATELGFVGVKLAGSAAIDATVNRAKLINKSPNVQTKADIKLHLEGGAQVVIKSNGSIAIEGSGPVGIESDALIKLCAPTIMVDGTLNVNGVTLTAPK